MGYHACLFPSPLGGYYAGYNDLYFQFLVIAENPLRGGLFHLSPMLRIQIYIYIYMSLCSILELGIFVSCKHSRSIEFFFMYGITCSLFDISLIPPTFKDATLSSSTYFHLGALTLVSSSYFTGSS